MSNIRDLLLNNDPTSLPYKQQQIAVYGGREGTGVQDGGRCCCWLIPTGTTWATFELWGAGGDGAGACCCQGQYRSGGTGQYAKKTVAINANSGFYIICAAGSGCCAQSCCGQCGFPSYVLCCDVATKVACGAGGTGACGVCGHMGGLSCTGLCVAGQWQGCNGMGDMQLPSLSNPDKQNNFCVNANFQFAPMGLKYMPNTRRSFDPCAVGMTAMGCCYWGGQMTTWPGGPGSSGQACGGPCCWGGWGTGGLVLITYG